MISKVYSKGDNQVQIKILKGDIEVLGVVGSALESHSFKVRKSQHDGLYG